MSTLFEAVFSALRQKKLLLVPQTKHEKKGWQDTFHLLGLDKPDTARFFIKPETLAQLTAIKESLSDGELTKLIQQIKLPFKKLWVEFPEHLELKSCSGKFSGQRYGFFLTPTRAGKGNYGAYFFLSAASKAGHVLTGVGGALFTFVPDSLPEVTSGVDFMAGTDNSVASKFVFDSTFIATPKSAMDEFERFADAGNDDFAAEMRKGSLVGVGAGSIILGSMRKELFILLWLLTSRIIKPGYPFSVRVLQRTKTRGTVNTKLDFSATEIDLLRVKEINDQPPRPSPSTGGHKSEHEVMGHWAVMRKSGLKFWRVPHKRGTLPPKAPREYSVKTRKRSSPHAD